MPPKYNLGNFIFLMSIPGNFAAIYLVFFMTSLISSLHHLLSFFQLGFQRFPRSMSLDLLICFGINLKHVLKIKVWVISIKSLNQSRPEVYVGK